MKNPFENYFRIHIDTSACTSIITGHERKINDTWYYSDQYFESGKIYAFVSEYRQGAMYLAYLLGGKLDFNSVRIYCNDAKIDQNDLKSVSWNLEPNCELYGRKQVKKSIEKAMSQNGCSESFQEIAEKFLLTPERYHRSFRNLSGERWRAAAALGYANGKKLFYAPYNPSTFYYAMCQSNLLKVLRVLTDYGATVFLPVGSDAFVKHIADEVIVLNPEYVTNTMPSSIEPKGVEQQ